MSRLRLLCWISFLMSAGFLLLLAVVVATGQDRIDSKGHHPSASAVENFKKIQADLRYSRAHQHWRSYQHAAEELKKLLHGAPDSLLELARADVDAGNEDLALKELHDFVRMGQSTNLVARSPEFLPLRRTQAYKQIESQMAGNLTPISPRSSVLSLSDPGLLAEDVDYDPRSKRFFVTSVLENKIISVDDDQRISDFAHAPDNWPMLAIKIDSVHRVVWATEVAMRGFDAVPKPNWGKSALLCYDVDSRKLLRRIEAPFPSAIGDIALTKQGDVIASDGEGGGVYRIPRDGRDFQHLDQGDFISPQTPAIHPDGKHLFVPDYARGIGVLGIATKHVSWLPTEDRFALSGVDGLYFAHGRLIAVQNGTSPERVVVFTLDQSLARIVAETIIERSTKTLGDPTHGLVIENEFFYLANSGWDAVDDHGKVKTGVTMTAPSIVRAQLPAR